MKYNLMAKQNTKMVVMNSKKGDKPKGKPKQKKQKSDPVSRDLEIIARHISDPCNSDLSSSGLPGQKGMIARFIHTLVVDVLAGKFAMYTFVPSTSTYSFSNNKLVGDEVIPNILSNGGPGTSFLNSNVAKSFRPLGACVELINTNTIMTKGGSYSFLHTPVETIHEVGSDAGQYMAAANERGQFGMDSVEVKWRPGMLDDTYGTWDATGGEPKEFTDKNCLTVVLGAGTVDQTIEIRTTLICEWVPNIGHTANGLVTPLTGGSCHNIRSAQVVAMLDQQRPHWWYQTAKAAGKLAWGALEGFAKRQLGV